MVVRVHNIWCKNSLHLIFDYIYSPTAIVFIGTSVFLNDNYVLNLVSPSTDQHQGDNVGDDDPELK